MENYSICDVFPIHKAVTKFSGLYVQPIIGSLKETITLISAASKFLEDSNKSGGIFSFGFRNKDLYESVRGKIVGGLSFVFNRYKKVNETVIDDANVESVVCYDANALYLSAFGGNTLTVLSTHFAWNQQKNSLLDGRH